MSELADEYFLSLDSIKKIVYGKKEKELLFEPTVESAVKYANAGLLEEWLTLFYSTFCEESQIAFDDIICCGIMKVPLRLIDSEVAINDISAIVENKLGTEVPIFIRFERGRFLVEGQQELLQNLKQKKINAYPALLMVQKEEYKQFERRYGRHFVVVS